MFVCLSILLRTKLATSNIIIIACAVSHNIAIEKRLINDEEFELPDANDDHEGEGDAHNVAGGPQKRQAVVDRWF